MSQPTQYPPHGQQWPPPAPARNGFGITALVLAIIGVVFGLIPLTGFIALVLGLLAVLFGLLGLGRVRRRIADNKILTIIGTALGVLSTVLGIIGIVIVFNAFDQLGQDLDAIGGPPPVVQPEGAQIPTLGDETDVSLDTPAFPGAEPGDVAAAYGQVVTVGPIDLTAETPVDRAGPFGDELVCSTVTYSNVGNGAAPFNTFDWGALSPAGTITGPAFSDADLGSGEVVPGASVSGLVCFDGALADGAWTVIYKPVFGDQVAFTG